MSTTVRVELPSSLCTLARLPREVSVQLDGPATQRALLDVLETDHPALRGLIRDAASGRRRPFLRFFACEEDRSHDAPDLPLPQAVVDGTEIFVIIGAIAGG